jgi:type IV pilus assembly protein PilM
VNLKQLAGFSEFFALDIGTTAVRIVQLRGAGATKSLVRYGSVPIDAKTSQSDAASDQKRLADVVAQAVKQTGVSVKDVVVGIPSNKMFATVVDFPKLPHGELEKTIQYQLESHIPMAINESKVDWAVLGDSPANQDSVEVLLAAVSNSFAETRLDMLEGMGLNVIAIEPDGIALCRSLLPLNATGAYLVLDIGDKATDLVISYAGTPRLVRSIPTGGSTFVKAAQQNLNIDEKQAAQFVYKFGLNPDKLEGQVYRALESTADSLLSEIQKSIKYFSTRYNGASLEKIVVSGGASTLPGFPLHVANKLGIQVEIGNAWLNVSYPQSKHNDLLALSNHFAVAVGLAERDS